MQVLELVLDVRVGQQRGHLRAYLRAVVGGVGDELEQLLVELGVGRDDGRGGRGGGGGRRSCSRCTCGACRRWTAVVAGVDCRLVVLVEAGHAADAAILGAGRGWVVVDDDVGRLDVFDVFRRNDRLLLNLVLSAA